MPEGPTPLRYADCGTGLRGHPPGPGRLVTAAIRVLILPVGCAVTRGMGGYRRG